MKILKKVLSLVLVAVMLIGIVPIMPVEVEATTYTSWYENQAVSYSQRKEGKGTRIANCSSTYYTTKNAMSQGQCTWYCFGRAWEKCGIEIPRWAKNSQGASIYGNANTWYSNAQNAGWSTGWEVKSNSIACYSSTHVVFIEWVDGNTVYYTEANFGPANNALDSSDGILTKATLSDITNCSWRPGYQGCIYLDGNNSNTPAPTHTVDSSYGTNFSAYPKEKITYLNIFDEYHNNLSSGHWIGTSDNCTIHEVYTDGCCKVSYPLDSGGTKTVYSKISLFNVTSNNYVDIGTNFYALILNNEHWKIIENKNGVVQTANEIGNADQLWYFVRESDGSYRIYSCENGQCLDVYGAYSDSGTKIQTYPAHDTDAQRWYIYEQSGGYVLKPKCSDCVLDLPNNDPSNGNQLQIWTKNDTGAQIWAIYRNDSILLKAPNMTIKAGTSITPTTFYWDDVRGEKRYDVKIYRDYIDVSNEYHIEWGATSGYSIILPAGKYQAYVDSTHEFDCKRSNVIEFTVEPSYRIAHWFGMFENGEGNNGDNDQILFGTNDYSSYNGAKFTLGSGKALSTIPNGFYLRDTFGTPSISGEWNGFTMGTVVTQGANDMYFEYYYRAAEYKITYKLNGGTNASSNPSTYNVLYGFTLANPTREGYTFAGWTDANGNKVTGINPGKNASFATNATYEQFCNELAGRTTGAQTLTANWIADSYTITYDANGGAGAPEPQTALCGETITLSQTTPKRTGYTFMGWSVIQYSDSMFGSDYFPGDSFKVTSNTVLYATWLKGCDNDHSFETTVTNPTCTDGGYTTYVCIYCDLTYNDDETAPLGHSEELVSYLAPTCTDDGYTGDIICTTCNSVFEYGETIEKLGHTYTVEVLKSPTADTKGAYEANCEVCKDYALNSLPALNDDNYVIEEITKPSCEYDGLTRYTLKDTTYGEITIDVTTEKTGHSYKATVIAPTCTEGGHTEYVCSSCNDSYADSYTTATGHSYVDGICTACGAVSDETGDEGTHGSGDANGDGMINSMDANIVKRILAGAVSPTNDQIKNADLDGDGELNSIDANLLSKLLSGSN